MIASDRRLGMLADDDESYPRCLKNIFHSFSTYFIQKSSIGNIEKDMYVTFQLSGQIGLISAVLKLPSKN